MPSTRLYYLLAGAALVVSGSVLASCTDIPTTTPPEKSLRLAIVSGNAQVGDVGSTLAAPLVVRVTDEDGKPVASRDIRFGVTSGGGSLRDVDKTSDAEGLASAHWTLGSTLGVQSVKVVALSPNGDKEMASVTFSATAEERAAPVASIVLSPDSARLVSGDTVVFVAVMKDSAGNVLRDRVLTWSSSNTAVASVSPSGLVRAIAGGKVVVSAFSEGKTGTATVEVVERVAPVAVVTVTPNSYTMNTGDTLQFVAILKDANGNVLTDRTTSWSSSAPSIASVSQSGVVSGLSRGSVVIAASSEGQTGTASVQVLAGPSSAYNEPAGFTKITDRPFNSKANYSTDRGDRITCVGGSECWAPVEYQSSWTLVNDDDAPAEGTSVAQQRYPAGMAGGTAPQGEAYKWWAIETGYRTIYHRFWMKLSDNWQGHLTGTSKIWHIWAEPRNIVYYSAHGTGSNPLRFAINLQGVPEPDLFEYRYNLPNVLGQEQTSIVRGQWHLFEVLLTLNVPGQKNGVIRVWQDGILTHDYTERELIGPSVTNPFWWEVQWSPTWGGLGDTLRQEQFMWIDQVYISGGK